MPQSVSGPTPTLCMYVVVSAGDPHRAFTELGYKKWFQLTLRDRDFRERLTFFLEGPLQGECHGNGPLDR
ncbi:BZ3500_MvSof-1268-A1-R1_Chr1-1g01196 [Microbotryum saponariae]|uniref:BZ3500_MvSof-1268-A1-R1_Chr1-1g01196 protein n=1 Tax=Microbotryum saponariae TaxID=289078 RepID=A0A2X0K8P1_9BASI|nr:BZ3500_MvSof-1268-A1-R1_Chr1-1g01196 [Microbotryum saponariae]SCZ93632.1 BZ3501_MvSof-1269-A2-R1_Chr1-1g00792 [Microbotryum saponariae]